MENKKIRLSEIMPLLEEKLSEGGSVELPITGTSMLPLLVQGRDRVIISKADKQLKKYDLPLYKRDDGAFVLHRVVAACGGTYTMCGDNQWIKEKDIRPEQIVGVTTAIIRKGKKFSTGSFRYKIYTRFWGLLFPARRYIVRIRGKIKK